MVLFDGLFSDHPELLAFGIFIIGMGVARWGFTKIPMMRLVARTVMFVAFTYFLWVFAESSGCFGGQNIEKAVNCVGFLHFG